MIEHVDCISGGRYCANDPDDNGPLTGRDVILEGLRQMCMKGNMNKYFSYIQLAAPCFTTFDKACLNSSLEKAGFTFNSIYTCINYTFQ
jgi:hypothetical protein